MSERFWLDGYNALALVEVNANQPSKVTKSLFIFSGSFMSMFNSLSYATKLVNAGLPRAQAEVHAQELQEVLEREQEQYVTKADLIPLSQEAKAEIANLKITLEAKIDDCKAEFSSLRADIAVLTNSHKFVLWIGGGVATMALSVFGLFISTLLPSLN